MSIPTTQNIFHGKIELSFFIQHQKQLLSELVLLDGFIITFMNFQFKPLPTNGISVLALRDKKMEQNEKALILALISVLSLNRLCPESSTEEHIVNVPSYFSVGNIAPDPTLFYFSR